MSDGHSLLYRLSIFEEGDHLNRYKWSNLILLFIFSILGHAHTDRVRQEFSQLFQFKVYYLLEELFSPVITPIVLMFWVKPRARQIVDFFHRFTVDVEGLGDVCSFAQMDIRKHGDPKWHGGDQDTQSRRFFWIIRGWRWEVSTENIIILVT